MLTWIWVALIGLVIGAIAKFLVPGKQGGGMLVTMLLGIGGSLAATFIGQQLGIDPCLAQVMDDPHRVLQIRLALPAPQQGRFPGAQETAQDHDWNQLTHLRLNSRFRFVPNPPGNPARSEDSRSPWPMQSTTGSKPTGTSAS